MDGQILRTVLSPFLKKFPNSGIWARHDAFVIPPNCFFEIQDFYKQGIYDTFFKKDVVGVHVSTSTNSQTDLKSENETFYIKTDFNRSRIHKKETSLNSNYNSDNKNNSKESPLFIFQILLISNFFNLLDCSLFFTGSIKGFKIKNKERLKEQNNKLKQLLLGFLYDPTFDKIYDIIVASKNFDTIFTFNKTNVKNLK